MKLIVFILLFLFIYPIQLRFFPLATDRLFQLLGFLILCFDTLTHRRAIVRILSSKSVLRFLFVTVVLLLLAILTLFQPKAFGGFDLSFVNYCLNVFLNIFAAYFFYVLLKKAHKNVNIQLILYYLVILALLQSCISILFFINPNLLNIYFSYLSEADAQGLKDRLWLINVRFIGIGSQFFGGAIKFAFAFFSLLILPYISNFKIIKNKFVYWVVMFLIVVGGVLTARTFFIAIILGVLMVIKLKTSNLFDFVKNILQIIIIGLISLVTLLGVANLTLSAKSKAQLFDFAFEMFINDSGSDQALETKSTDKLLEMYQILPNSAKTWWIGDGKLANPNGSGYYKGTDVGYIRLIFYFGLPSTVFFVFLLITYYKSLVNLLNVGNKELKLLFGVVLLFELLCNLKGLSFESNYFTLFLIILVLTQRPINRIY